MEGLIFNDLKQSAEHCPIHNIPFLTYLGRKACPSCEEEALKKREIEYQQRMTFKHQKRITYDRLYKDSLVSDLTIKKAEFNTFHLDNDESKQNKQAAIQIANRYLNGEVFNTLLTGNAGTGKTHLAMSIAKEVNENSNPWRSVLFLSIDEWLLWIRSTYSDNDNLNKDDEKSILNNTASHDLLILDDLGAETGFIGTKKTASDFTQKMLYGLMNRRQDKSTIITTNLNSKQLSAMYDQKVISRLYKGVNKDTVIKFKESKDKRISF